MNTSLGDSQDRSTLSRRTTSALALLVVASCTFPWHAACQLPQAATAAAADHVFRRPLMCVGPEGSTTPMPESFSRALQTFMESIDTVDALAGLSSFGSAASSSPWAPSLAANLGEVSADVGLYSRALEQWRAAWDLTKQLGDANAKSIADSALVNLGELLLKLGRTEEVGRLLDEAGPRLLASRPLEQRLAKVKEDYAKQLHHPDLATRCGYIALYEVARALHPSDTRYDDLIQASKPHGCALADLETSARNHGLDLTALANGSFSGLPLPFVIHWRSGHYAAVLEREGERYKILDSVFPGPRWVSRRVLESEGTGFCLARLVAPTAGWRRATAEEARAIQGRGYATTIDDSADLYQPLPLTLGLPDWRVSEPFISLWIEAEATRYLTSAGKPMVFDVAFRQRDIGDHSTEFSLGDGWECSWAGYVDYSYTVEPDEDNPGWYYYYMNGEPAVHEQLGGSLNYTADGTAHEYSSYRSLAITGQNFGRTGNAWFTIAYPDGTLCCYDWVQYRSANARRSYLSAVRDPQGRWINFNYTTTNTTVTLLHSVVDYDSHTNRVYYDSLHPYQISQVVDPYGATNRFYYNNSGLLTNILNAEGIASTFTYDEHGVVTNMGGAYGSTAFKYAVNTNSGNVVNRSMVVTEPDGRQHVFVYRDQCDKVNAVSSEDFLPCAYPSSEVPVAAPFTNTFDNTWVNARNSFYWSPLACTMLSETYQQTKDLDRLSAGDYSLATMNHWLIQAGTFSTLGATKSIARAPSPDGIHEGLKVWYDYWGQQPIQGTNCSGGTVTNFYREGAAAYPRLSARVLPAGETQFNYFEYNAWGNPTLAVENYSTPAGVALRTNKTIYASNGIDIAQQYNAAGTLVSSNVYLGSPYDTHLVATNYDALEQMTVCTFGGLLGCQPATVLSPGGLTTSNAYYTSGLYSNYLMRVSELEIGAASSVSYSNGLVHTTTDARGVTTTNWHDRLQRLIKSSDPRGSVISVYTNYSLLYSVDRLGATNWNGYDCYGRLVWSADSLGRTNRLGYYSWGAPRYLTNALGQVSELVYDRVGRRISALGPDRRGSTNEYDFAGRLVRTIDADGVSSTNYYNLQGLVYAVSNAAGQVSYRTYDVLDRVTNSLDAARICVTAEFDALGRVTKTRRPSDGSESSVGYCFFGASAATNALGKTTFFAYDAAGRKTAVTNANGEVTRFLYNAAGSITNLIDAKNHNTFFYYDSFGRLTNKVDDLGRQFEVLAYDQNDRLTNRYTPAKGATRYLYDAVGSLTNIVYPTDPSITASYDALNRVTNVVDGIGTTRLAYSDAGLLASEDGPWADDVITFSRNANRSLSNVCLSMPGGQAASKTYAYDAAGRLGSISAPEGSYVYSYVAATEWVRTISFPNQCALTNWYDAVGQLRSTTLEDRNHVAVSAHGYEYDLLGQVTRQTRLDGSYADYTHDAIGQILGASAREPSGQTRPHESFGYTYDAGGNLSWRTNNDLVQGFAVNSVNELTGVNRTTSLTTVSGGVTGAATNVAVNTVDANLYGDGSFALQGVNLQDGENTFAAVAKDALGRLATNSATCWLPAQRTLTYDANGNMTSDGRHGFDYDDENRLVRITRTNAWKSEFHYDAWGRRRLRNEFAWSTGAWVQVEEVRYVYQGKLVIQERDANGQATVTYTRGPDLSGSGSGAGGAGGLLARKDHSLAALPNAVSYYHADRLGNVTTLVDTAARTVARYLYDPYGSLIAASGPLADLNLYRASSKEAHVRSGLVYFGSRYYYPELQRWLNRDPIGEAGGLNLHAYGLNSPVALLDPWGQFTIPDIRRKPVNNWQSGWGSLPWLPFGRSYVIWLNPDHIVTTPDGRTVPLTEDQWRCYCRQQVSSAANYLNSVMKGPSGPLYCATWALSSSGQSWLGDQFRQVPVLGGLLGGTADMITGLANVMLSAVSAGHAGTLQTGLNQVGWGLARGLSGSLTVAGYAWDSPNTAVGLGLGTVGFGASCAAYASGFSTATPAIKPGGGQLRFVNDVLQFFGDLTLGDVALFGPGTAPNTPIPFANYTYGQHESSHTPQGHLLGPFYLPAYLGGLLPAAVWPQYPGGPFGPSHFMEIGPYLPEITGQPSRPWL